MKRGRDAHGGHSRLHVCARLLSGPAPNAPRRQPPQPLPSPPASHSAAHVVKVKQTAPPCCGVVPAPLARACPKGQPPCCVGAQLSSGPRKTSTVVARFTVIPHYVCSLLLYGRQMYIMRALPCLHERSSCQGAPALSCVRPSHFVGPFRCPCHLLNYHGHPKFIHGSACTAGPHSVCSPGQGLWCDPDPTVSRPTASMTHQIQSRF